MTAVALADDATRWAAVYVADSAGLPVYAATVAARGSNPLDARATWDNVVRWHPWWPTYAGTVIGRELARRGVL